MKTKVSILIIVTISGFALNKAHAQNSTSKKDTVYYLLDTLNTPALDRMIKASEWKDYVFYRIQCPCLKDSVEPVFRGGLKMKTYIDKQTFNSYKMISLSDLIEFVRKNDNMQFDKKHVIYFLEHVKDGYTKNKVFFQGGGIDRSIDDRVTMPIDTSKHKKP